MAVPPPVSRSMTQANRNDSIAGITAIQNTMRIFPASAIISPTATSGARNAPTVSSDWRRPNAAPRISGGVSSAIIASRGAPRMPLPIRSTNRAPSTGITPLASGNNGFDSAPIP